MEFKPWKDYFQLAALVKEMARMNIGDPWPANSFQLNPAVPTERQVKGKGSTNYGAAAYPIPIEGEDPVISMSPDSYYEVKPASSHNVNQHLTYKNQPKTLDEYQSELGNTSHTPTLSPTKRKGRPQSAICHFCKHNGEAQHVYSDHNLKDEQGKVVCPVLRMYTCSLCGATGESSHTRKYCPLNKSNGNGNRNRKAERNSAGHRMKY